MTESAAGTGRDEGEAARILSGADDIRAIPPDDLSLYRDAAKMTDGFRVSPLPDLQVPHGFLGIAIRRPDTDADHARFWEQVGALKSERDRKAAGDFTVGGLIDMAEGVEEDPGKIFHSAAIQLERARDKVLALLEETQR